MMTPGVIGFGSIDRGLDSRDCRWSRCNTLGDIVDDGDNNDIGNKVALLHDWGAQGTNGKKSRDDN